MFLKTQCARKDGQEPLDYSWCESLRGSRSRVTPRPALRLGELNPRPLDRWQRAMEAVQEEGRRNPLRLFPDQEGGAPAVDEVAELILSSLGARRPRRFGERWIGGKLWEEWGLRAFWARALGEERGEVPWAQVVERLGVNRLGAPRSELSAQEKGFAPTAMDLGLDTDESVAKKDRL
jgi:hypothetical protein